MKHWDAVEASLLAEYRLDLREVVYGRRPYGARRLYALIKHLPSDSALAREVHPSLRAGWTSDTYLLASLLESYVNAHLEKGAKQFRIPRPSDPVPVQAGADQLEAFAAQHGGIVKKTKTRKEQQT